MIPEKLEGCKVLDLGSGSGRDCYVLSKLVGERGQVIGLDMTGEMVRHRSDIPNPLCKHMCRIKKERKISCSLKLHHMSVTSVFVF